MWFDIAIDFLFSYESNRLHRTRFNARMNVNARERAFRRKMRRGY